MRRSPTRGPAPVQTRGYPTSGEEAHTWGLPDASQSAKEPIMTRADPPLRSADPATTRRRQLETTSCLQKRRRGRGRRAEAADELSEETGIDLTDASELDADNVPADEEFDRVMQAPGLSLGAGLRRGRAASASSSVKPTLSVTCQWAILPSATWPRCLDHLEPLDVATGLAGLDDGALHGVVAAVRRRAGQFDELVDMLAHGRSPCNDDGTAIMTAAPAPVAARLTSWSADRGDWRPAHTASAFPRDRPSTSFAERKRHRFAELALEPGDALGVHPGQGVVMLRRGLVLDARQLRFLQQFHRAPYVAVAVRKEVEHDELQEINACLHEVVRQTPKPRHRRVCGGRLAVMKKFLNAASIGVPGGTAVVVSRRAAGHGRGTIDQLHLRVIHRWPDLGHSYLEVALATDSEQVVTES